MTRKLSRCVVTFTSTDGKQFSYFLYGVSADGFNNPRAKDVTTVNDFVARKQRELPQGDYTVVASAPPDLPARTTPIIYSRGRRSPEFV